MDKSMLKVLAVAVVVVLPLHIPSVAATMWIQTTVSRTMVGADDKFGGCMVQLADALPSELDCPDQPWVTLSCSGDHVTSKANAMRMLDSAQMAFFTGRQVRVYIDDQRKHNGFCFAYRVDVL